MLLRVGGPTCIYNKEITCFKQMKMYNKRNQDLPLDHYLVMEVAINPQKGRLLMSLESKGVNSGSYLARNKISVCS